MSQSLIDAAKASILAYNDKNWDAVSKVLTSDVEYDEVATHRKVTGAARCDHRLEGMGHRAPRLEGHLRRGPRQREHGGHRVDVARHAQRPAGDALGRRAGHRQEDRDPRGADHRLTPDGKTRSVRHYFDMATMLAQLGISAVGT